MTVYQASEEGEESSAPQPTVQMAPPVTDVAVDEPVLQASAPTPQKVNDVSDIVKKWSVKT